jgi:hypothetical protein
LVQGAFAALMRQDLVMEEDDARALRRALPALVWLVQDDLSAEPSSRVARDFIAYLLLHFAPLAGHFDSNHCHVVARGEHVMRARLDDERVGLLIRQELGQRLLAEGIECVEDTPDE